MDFDRLLTIISLRVRSLFRRNDVERELDEELQYHVDKQTEVYVARGMSVEEARLTALRAFGGIELRKSQVRDVRGLRLFEELPRDISFAVRSLRNAKGFAIAVILTLALGIGANTAMFTLLRGTLLRPLPNNDGDRLVYLRQSSADRPQQNRSFSVPEVADYRAASKTLAELAEYSMMQFNLVARDGQQVRVVTGIVTGNYFDVMGLEPVAGRLISTQHDGPSASHVAVLSHHYWIEHFGGDSSIVGRTIRINDKVATVLGVVQPAPHYPSRTDVFVNMAVSPHHLSATMVTGRTHRMSELFARLADGRTVEEARDELTQIASVMFREHPEAYEKAAQFSISVSPLRDAVNERSSQMFWLLMGTATFVLLIACANVANLVLMRGVGREREMVVRAALGAGSARLRRLLIVENLTLALIGGALGIVVAYGGLGMLVAFASQLSPRASEITVDGVVLAVGLGTSILAALALSFVPRIDGHRSLASTLAAAGRRSTLGRGRVRLQHSLVIAQLAVCMILLTGAGLLVRTFANLASVDTGVRGMQVLAMDLPISGSIEALYADRAQNRAKYERIRDQVAAIQGVEMAAIGSQAPLRTTTVGFDVKAEGRPTAPDQPTPAAALRIIDPQYLQTAGIPMVKGRTFAASDHGEAAKVVLINQTLAKMLFGDEDPIGRRVAWTGEVLKFSPISPEWRTVVGIVGDTRDGTLDAAPRPVMYEPFLQELTMGSTLLVKTSGDPTLLQPTITRAIRELDPGQIIERVSTLEQIRDSRVAPRKLNAMFISSFGTLALVIAMVGIAGVLAFSVSARTSEIGIRMSFGATAARVQRMVMREGGVLLGAGLFIGLGGALLTTRLLRGLLFGVTPSDPVTLGGVGLTLIAIGLAACWLPAARAARVDPVVALRSE